MDNMKELVTVQKSIMLDGGKFGHWKATMQHIIRGIDENAWKAVEEGWSASTVLMEDQTLVSTPEDK